VEESAEGDSQEDEYHNFEKSESKNGSFLRWVLPNFAAPAAEGSSLQLGLEAAGSAGNLIIVAEWNVK